MKQTIQTIEGLADYILTEREDANGKWNDNYYVKFGYYVIHEGNEHHVYKIRERKGKCDHCGNDVQIIIKFKGENYCADCYDDTIVYAQDEQFYEMAYGKEGESQ